MNKISVTYQNINKINVTYQNMKKFRIFVSDFFDKGIKDSKRFLIKDSEGFIIIDNTQ
jgi:hypothetical protein